MSTEKPRFMVTTSNEIAEYIHKKARLYNKSASQVIREIIEEAIDQDEDEYLSRIASEAEERSAGMKTIQSSEVWKQCDLI